VGGGLTSIKSIMFTIFSVNCSFFLLLFIDISLPNEIYYFLCDRYQKININYKFHDDLILNKVLYYIICVLYMFIIKCIVTNWVVAIVGLKFDDIINVFKQTKTLVLQTINNVS